MGRGGEVRETEGWGEGEVRERDQRGKGNIIREERYKKGEWGFQREGERRGE